MENVLYFDNITIIFIFTIVVELFIAIILVLFISIIKTDLKIDEIYYKGIENNIEDDKKVDNKIKENKNGTSNKSQTK